MNARRAHSGVRAESASDRGDFASPTTAVDRVAWSTHSRDAHAAYLERTCSATEQLATRCVELVLSLADSSRSNDSFGGSAGSRPFADPPLRLGVLSALAEIASDTVTLVSSSRAALSLPQNAAAPGLRGTVSGLTWLAGVIPSVWDSDAATGRTAAQTIWRHHGRTGRLLGLVATAFRIEEPCPSCGLQSLWVDPDSWSIACGRDRCGYHELIEARPVRWVSDS